jgi:hypothetical protein
MLHYSRSNMLGVGALSAGLQVLAACSAAGQSDKELEFVSAADDADERRALADGTQASSVASTPPEDASCAEAHAQATLVKHPVDIVLVADNSGSMASEVTSVERNINVNFADILEAAGIDYRVILISRHRTTLRGMLGHPSFDTGICIEAPLSGLTHCPAAGPIASQHFVHYDTPVGSHDSLRILLDTYRPEQSWSPEIKSTLSTPVPDEGWGRFLRPGVPKVFVELTDDDAYSSGETFLYELKSVAPEFFDAETGRPSFVFHSIVGLRAKAAPGEAYMPTEPIQTETCVGDDNTVENAGKAYQELSRITGGLRFPLCEFEAYDVVFSAIAEDVIEGMPVACDFDIPEQPQGRTVDTSNIALSYTPSAGAKLELAQVRDATSCEADAFYVSGEQIRLCPEACSHVQEDASARLHVSFTCRNTLIH